MPKKSVYLNPLVSVADVAHTRIVIHEQHKAEFPDHRTHVVQRSA